MVCVSVYVWTCVCERQSGTKGPFQILSTAVPLSAHPLCFSLDKVVSVSSNSLRKRDEAEGGMEDGGGDGDWANGPGGSLWDGVAAGSNLGLGARQLCRTRRCEGRRTRRKNTSNGGGEGKSAPGRVRTLLHGSG